jgi:hypothetical protein
MREVTKTYKVYSLDELSEEAREKAISDEIQFYIECVRYEDMPKIMQKAIDKAERMQTPWFTGSYIYDYCKDDIIETIKLNEFTFLENGEMFTE